MDPKRQRSVQNTDVSEKINNYTSIHESSDQIINGYLTKTNRSSQIKLAVFVFLILNSIDLFDLYIVMVVDFVEKQLFFFFTRNIFFRNKKN